MQAARASCSFRDVSQAPSLPVLSQRHQSQIELGVLLTT